MRDPASPIGWPKTSPIDGAGSVETSSTRRPGSSRAAASAMAAAQVVLPLPPFLLKNTSRRAPAGRRRIYRVSRKAG
jgi:hypothetical protein